MLHSPPVRRTPHRRRCRIAVEALDRRLQPSAGVTDFPQAGLSATVAAPLPLTVVDVPLFPGPAAVSTTRAVVGPVTGGAPSVVVGPPRRELYLVALDVPDRDALVRDLLSQPDCDGRIVEFVGGIHEVTAALRQWSDLNAVHLITHGAIGTITIGPDVLDVTTLSRFESEFRDWGAALAPDGDLLLYGCDVAADGGAFVTRLSSLTGADVAASTDPTGASDLGGDWKLEYAAGEIETAALSATGWSHTLPAVSLALLGPGISVTGDSLVVATDGAVVRLDALTGVVLDTYPTGLENDGVAVAPDGSIYFADYLVNRVRHYSATGTFLGSFSTSGRTPQGLTFGPDGNLYVTTTSSSVERFRPDGSNHQTFITAGSGGLNNAKGIVWGPDGNAYVSSYFNSEVIRYDGATGAFLDVFAAGSGGFEDLTFGPDGNLYVASYGDGAVYRYRGTDGTPLGAFATGVTTAYGLRFDPAGDLVVSSRAAGRLGRYDGATGAFLGDLVTGLTNPAYVADTSSLVTTSAGGVATFRVVLDSQPTADVTVTLLSSAPGQGALARTSLTFTPADWNVPQAVRVTGLDDGIANGGQVYSITGIAVSGDSAYSGLAMPLVTVVNLEVVVPNQAPVATDDADTTPEDTPLTVASPGVLGNDYDPDGDPTTAGLAAGPIRGRVTLNADGSFTYTPAADYAGPDSFTYTVADGRGGTAVGTVTLTVTAVNDAPAAADDGYATAQDTPLAVSIGVLANDSDIDGDALAAAVATGPANGTLTLNADGTFTYTPAAGFSGTDGFTYQATDGLALSPVAAVTLRVVAAPAPPVAIDDAFTVTSGQVLAVSGAGLLANDTPSTTGALTAVFDSGPSHGTLALNADGSFTYTPDAGFSGTDTFTYRATDGRLVSSVVQVTVTVSALPTPDPTPTPSPPSAPEPSPTPTTPEPPKAPVAPGPTAAPPVTTTATPQLPNTPQVSLAPSSTGTALDFAPSSGIPTGTISPLPLTASSAGTPSPRTAEPLGSDAGRVYSVGEPAAAIVPVPPEVTPPPTSVAPQPTPAPPVQPPPVVVLPTTPPVAAPPTAPEVVAQVTPTVSVPDSYLEPLDRVRDELRAEAAERATTDTIVVTGGVAVAGVVLLNTRAVYWFLSALLARPAVWRRFDPLDVLYAWERDGARGAGPDDSLQSMVG